MFLNLHKTFKAGFTVLQFPKNVLILANSADPDKRTSISPGPSLFPIFRGVRLSDGILFCHISRPKHYFLDTRKNRRCNRNSLANSLCNVLC